MPEIQNLVHDVGGLEEELQLRKALWQLAPEIGHMLRRRRVLFIERDKDFAVHRPDRRRVGERDVNSAIGQADIVEDDIDLIIADDVADGAFDFREIALRFLDLRARRRADMQAHLPGIDLREEVHAKPRIQCQRRPNEEGEERDGDQRPADHPGQRITMNHSQNKKAMLERAMDEAKRIEPPPRRLRAGFHARPRRHVRCHGQHEPATP